MVKRRVALPDLRRRGPDRVQHGRERRHREGVGGQDVSVQIEHFHHDLRLSSSGDVEAVPVGAVSVVVGDADEWVVSSPSAEMAASEMTPSKP